MSAKPTAARATQQASARPEKPYPEFPLFPHASGRWCKKIRRRFHYFGHWGRKKGDTIVPVEDIEKSAREAVEKLNAEWAALKEGRTPRVTPETGGVDTRTLREVCNAFWRSKRAKLLAGELSHRSFSDYERSTDLMISTWGKDRRVDDLMPDDFERLRSSLAARLGVHALKGEINRIRVVLKFAYDQRMIDRPVNYGQSFNRPTAKAMRKARNHAGQRMFEAAEVQAILNALEGNPVSIEGQDEQLTLAADPVLRAMVLLGVNCGFGNTDCATLPRSGVDLKTGWIDFPRPKTEIPRRIPLWPETIAALLAANAVRPGPGGREYADHTFLTRFGVPWVRVQEHSQKADKIVPIDALSQRFARLLKRLKINGRNGLNFYSLRHVFETVAGESRDQVAVNAIMGHVDSSMAGQYRERISDDRLQAVVSVVRKWLWPDAN